MKILYNIFVYHVTYIVLPLVSSYFGISNCYFFLTYFVLFCFFLSFVTARFVSDVFSKYRLVFFYCTYIQSVDTAYFLSM